jgi:hypothetical protein
MTTEKNNEVRAGLIAALKFHPSASHVNPDFRDLFNKTLDQHAAALAATAPNAGAPFEMTKVGCDCINAAAEALSKVLAFVSMPAYENEVSRALSGLRAMQALARQADAAEPVAREDARDVIGKALPDQMTENSEAGVFSTDPFDSREIDAFADAVLAAQAPAVRGEGA